MHLKRELWRTHLKHKKAAHRHFVALFEPEVAAAPHRHFVALFEPEVAAAPHRHFVALFESCHPDQKKPSLARRFKFWSG